MANNLHTLWERHRNSEWPRFVSPHQGELMTIDTVISGCVAYFLDSPDGLDGQRQSILESCLDDLNALLPELPDEVLPYFGQLRALATCLRNCGPT